MRPLCLFVLCYALFVACGRPKGMFLGKAPSGNPNSILAVQAGDTPTIVTLRGTMIEKCPVAGCWFRIRDDSGIIKVDTKTAGFVVTDVPLQTTVTVGGKVAAEGDETVLKATGLRY